MSQARLVESFNRKFDFVLSYEMNGNPYLTEPKGLSRLEYGHKIRLERELYEAGALRGNARNLKIQLKVWNQEALEVESEFTDFDALRQFSRPYISGARSASASSASEGSSEATEVTIATAATVSAEDAEAPEVTDAERAAMMDRLWDAQRDFARNLGRNIYAPEPETRSSRIKFSIAMGVLALVIGGAMFIGISASGLVPLGLGHIIIMTVSTAITAGLIDYFTNAPSSPSAAYERGPVTPDQVEASRVVSQNTSELRAINPLAWRQQATGHRNLLSQQSCLARRVDASASPSVVANDETLRMRVR